MESGIRPVIYCDEYIDSACHEIQGCYQRKLSDVSERLLCDPYFVSGKLKSAEEIKGFLGEYRLCDMFDWLSGRGWDMKYLKSEIEHCRKRLYPTGRGNSMEIKDMASEHTMEFDCILYLGGRIVIGEAKSGENSFKSKSARDRVDLLGNMTGTDAGFILGVPKDHSIRNAEKLSYFESMGGRVLFFPDDVQGLVAESGRIAAGTRSYP